MLSFVLQRTVKVQQGPSHEYLHPHDYLQSLQTEHIGQNEITDFFIAKA